MKNESKQNQISYISLIIFLALLIILYVAVWPDIVYQRYLALLMMFFYFFWGVIFHLKIGQINRKIVLEYLGISFLAGLMLVLITI